MNRAARSPACFTWSSSNRTFASFVDPFEREAGESKDGCQQVVEVVRNSAREPPDRFHFLRLLELSFDGLRASRS